MKRINMLSLKSFLVLATLLSIFHSHADFYEPSSLPQPRPKSWFQLQQASFRLFNNSQSTGDYCSASLISNNGYVITALHCLETCLSEQGLLQSRNFSKVEGKLLWLDQPATEANPIHCPHLHTEASPGLSSAEVVFTGKGYADFSDSHIGDFTDEEFQKMQEIVSDVAILKFKSERKLPCVKASWEKPAVNEQLWSLSSPALTRRTKNNSDGVNQFASTGFVTDDVLKNPFVKGYVEQNESLLPRFSKLANEKVFLTSLDFYGGSSGAPIFNKNGEIVGVTSSVIGPTRNWAEKNYVPYASMVAPLSLIKTQFSEGPSEEFLKQAFDCR